MALGLTRGEKKEEGKEDRRDFAQKGSGSGKLQDSDL